MQNFSEMTIHLSIGINKEWEQRGRPPSPCHFVEKYSVTIVVKIRDLFKFTPRNEI
jgi:hypothetical protein